MRVELIFADETARIFQYLEGGKVHRSRAVREASRFELFGDLLMVGVVHQLAEAAVEEVSGRSVARFILTFGPAWAMWSDLRNVGPPPLLRRLRG